MITIIVAKAIIVIVQVALIIVVEAEDINWRTGVQCLGRGLERVLTSLMTALLLSCCCPSIASRFFAARPGKIQPSWEKGAEHSCKECV